MGEKAVKKQGLASKLIGDKKFYKMILLIAVPIMIQNGITNFVSLLDNIMIGRIGTEQMSGAAIVNQLIFVYNLCIFGGVSGAGIFTAQYFGQKDQEGVRNTFRYKLWMALILTVATIIIFLVGGDRLIELYLHGEGARENAAATLLYGKQYLWIMLVGLPPFMMVQVYASTLRECGETVVPMKAGITAVLINLLFNYILIYGKFGAPVLGVRGAAIATVLSRYVEAVIVISWTHRHKEKNPYIEGLYRTLKVPAYMTKKILIKGTPLLFNEALWAAGMAMLTQCYSVRGLNVVAGLNISNTINNVFNIVFIALGDSVAIVVGQLLGAGEMKKAREKELTEERINEIKEELKRKDLKEEERKSLEEELKDGVNVKLEDTDKVNASYLRKAIKELNPKITDEKIDSYKESYKSFAWAVAVAPADDPEIAVVAMIPQGESSSNAMLLIREVLGSYFDLDNNKGEKNNKNDENTGTIEKENINFVPQMKK